MNKCKAAGFCLCLFLIKSQLNLYWRPPGQALMGLNPSQIKLGLKVKTVGILFACNIVSSDRSYFCSEAEKKLHVDPALHLAYEQYKGVFRLLNHSLIRLELSAQIRSSSSGFGLSSFITFHPNKIYLKMPAIKPRSVTRAIRAWGKGWGGRHPCPGSVFCWAGQKNSGQPWLYNKTKGRLWPWAGGRRCTWMTLPAKHP